MAESELRIPLVSVVIPFHNRLGWLAEAVESVKTQTYSNIEIVLVDDGSSEDVRAHLDLKDEAIRYVRQSNKGPSGARNCGIDLAQGEFVAFLDSDDLFAPEKVSRQLASMLDHADILISHTSYQRMDETGNLLEVIHSGQYSGWVFPEILLGCGIATPTVMVRRSALGRNLRFNEAVRFGEDLLLWAQLARVSAILGIDEPLSRVRLHDANAAFDENAQIQSLHNLKKYGIRRSTGISEAQRRKLLASNYHKIAHLLYRKGRKWRAVTNEAHAWMNDPGRFVLKGGRFLAGVVRHYISRLVRVCLRLFSFPSTL
jgi:glycosyltransferase involved in cell wall biosynthesis